MYKRFHPKASSPRAEPKQSGGKAGATAELEKAKLEAPSGEETGKNLRNVEERRPEQRADERSAVSSKIGMA